MEMIILATLVLILFFIQNPEVLLVGTVTYLTMYISFWFLPAFILLCFLIGFFINRLNKGGK